jgi:2-octaprenyl-6-methoxyphenol hydroxylase
MTQVDVTVVGGGLAGMIAAIAIARGGREVALLAPLPPRLDGRTTALMDQSIRFLERLAVWDKIAPSAAELSTMQIVDGTKRLLRAPTVAFRAAEYCTDRRAERRGPNRGKYHPDRRCGHSSRYPRSDRGRDAG